MFVFEGHDELLGLIPQTVLIQHYVSLRLLLKQLVMHAKLMTVTVDLTLFIEGIWLIDVCIGCCTQVGLLAVYATYGHNTKVKAQCEYTCIPEVSKQPAGVQ